MTKQFSQAQIKSVANLTQSNDHNRALLMVAKIIGDEDICTLLKCIIETQSEIFYMPNGLIRLRSLLYHRLKKHLNKYSNALEMYNAL